VPKLKRLVARPQVVRLGSVGSTQDAARGLPIGSVVVADHQTAGRGRLDRRWEGPSGTALLASFVLPAGPLLSLAAGVAAAISCGQEVRLKWPNDLLLEGRKLGGILVEVGADRKAVVGVGINLHWAPEGGAALGAERDPLLERLREELGRWSGAPATEIVAAWRRLSDTLGREVRVQLRDESWEGLAEDVDGEGALIVAGRRVVAGDVIYLRERAGEAGSPPTAPG
jgi:BirA family biotin operon repressor/biotin-[acetyl-CoA-carboxylase] ligase